VARATVTSADAARMAVESAMPFGTFRPATEKLADFDDISLMMVKMMR